MKKLIFKILCNLFFLIGGCVLFLLYYADKQLEPVAQEVEREKVKVDIPMGSSVKDIASILDSQGVIRNGDIFYYYLRIKNENNLQAGEYMLSPSMSKEEIIKIMREGRVMEETMKFTIPEGFNIEQIAHRLEKEEIVSAEEFIGEIQNGDFSDIALVKGIPEKREGKYRLEGYLFPETYQVREETTANGIIRTLLQQTEKEISKEWLEEIEKQGKTLHEIMTLASIIEEEAAVKEEQPIIAGVYYNRIKDNMLLQADATIQYALPETKQRIYYSDLEVESPYNTYKYPGLPPTPIASPGRKAIESAIYPEDHDYKFYVTKKDGTQEHYFTKTYEEHKEMNRLSKRSASE